MRKDAQNSALMLAGGPSLWARRSCLALSDAIRSVRRQLPRMPHTRSENIVASLMFRSALPFLSVQTRRSCLFVPLQCPSYGHHCFQL